MSQHNFNEPNEPGAAYRAGINAALQALASVSRGATAPTTTYAGMYWEDTTASLLKRRNAADSGWIIVDTLDETRVVSRSSNTILGLSDWGKTFLATSTFTQTLTAAATLGDDWHCFYRNDGSGVITIDPNSTETIDGSTVLVLFPGEGCRISCNGSGFTTQGLSSVKKINVNTTTVGNIGGGTDDLMTYSVPANTLWANGKGIRVTAWGTTANNANAKNLGVAWGSGSFSFALTASILGAWWCELIIIRTSANAQINVFRVTEVVNNSVLAANKEKQVTTGTSTETDTFAIVVKFTAAATTDNDIVQKGMIVESL